MVRHHALPELFQEMAVRLQKVADFQFLNFSLHNPLDKLMHLHWWEGRQGQSMPNLPTDVAVADSPSG